LRQSKCRVVVLSQNCGVRGGVLGVARSTGDAGSSAALNWTHCTFRSKLG
jgi:hypothetical protein